MGMERRLGPWVEIWELCERCDGTGIEPQTHIGMREACTAGCAGGKKRKMITLAEFRDLVHEARKGQG